MKLSQHLQKEWEFVMRSLPGCICKDCQATLGTYADQCSADFDDPCPGYLAIERAKDEFEKKRRSRLPKWR